MQIGVESASLIPICRSNRSLLGELTAGAVQEGLDVARFRSGRPGTLNGSTGGSRLALLLRHEVGLVEARALGLPDLEVGDQVLVLLTGDGHGVADEVEGFLDLPLLGSGLLVGLPLLALHVVVHLLGGAEDVGGAAIAAATGLARTEGEEQDEREAHADDVDDLLHGSGSLLVGPVGPGLVGHLTQFFGPPSIEVSLK